MNNGKIFTTNVKMPAKDTVALDDDVELRTVALASPLNRTMVKDAIYTEETIETAKGKVLVAFAGDRKKPAIVTYHDLGLNYISNFQARDKIECANTKSLSLTQTSFPLHNDEKMNGYLSSRPLFPSKEGGFCSLN